jgi:hypothetical protein
MDPAHRPNSDASSVRQADTYVVGHDDDDHDDVQENKQGSVSSSKTPSHSELQPLDVLFGYIPLSLAPSIFQYLDPMTLLRVSRISRAWNKAISIPALWHQFCLRDGITISPGISMDYLVERCHSDGANLWLEAWKDGVMLRRNWEQGQCTIHDIDVADIRDSITW